MEKLFATLEMENNLFIFIGLFLLITFIISTIVVFFISRLKTLSTILERAKEIDNAKELRMSVLTESLQAEKVKVFELRRELELYQNSKAKLKLSEEKIARLGESMRQQSQIELEKRLEQQNAFDELLIHCELLEKNNKQLTDKYELLKKRNEDLVSNNNRLHTEIRETKLKVKEMRVKLRKATSGE